MNIRKYIINNFKNNTFKEIKDAIDESLKSDDEVVLPGLGVFLEIIWKNSSLELKNTLVDILVNNLK